MNADRTGDVVECRLDGDDMYCNIKALKMHM